MIKTPSKIKLNTIFQAISDIKRGKMIIVVDDENRENEGDLVSSAQKATPEVINFMAKFARGLICVPLEKDRLDKLKIPAMVPDNTDRLETGFTVSIDARSVKTGISAHERALTVKKLIDSKTRPEDLSRPGHIFPLRAKVGGVLRRAGHTEASVDLARLAGLYPAGVICEIMNDDGTMARLSELVEFSTKHKLKIISVQDLIKYRLKYDKLIKKVAITNLPTKYGEFKLVAYESLTDSKTHLALIKGKITAEKPTLVRVHSSCLTGDVLGSLRCDCGEQVVAALTIINKKRSGVLLYMDQEGRGIGLPNKLRAYELQDKGLDTVEANQKLGFKDDLRDYGIGAQILVDLGIKKINLMTNNPRKIVAIKGYGLEVVKRVPLEIKANRNNKKYLRTKKIKLGHLLEKI